MLPVDDNWVAIPALIVHSAHLLEELLRDRRANGLAIHARADLTERERLKWLADREALWHLIRWALAELYCLAIGAQGCLFICCIHLLDHLSSPSETGIASPAIPSLPTFAVFIPSRALFVDLMPSEISEHPAHSLRREAHAIDQISSSSDADRGHAALALRLLSTTTQSALGCFACALGRLEIDVIVFLRRELLRLALNLSHCVASSQPQRAQRCRYLRLLFSRWLIAVLLREGRQHRDAPL